MVVTSSWYERHPIRSKRLKYSWQTVDKRLIGGHRMTLFSTMKPVTRFDTIYAQMNESLGGSSILLCQERRWRVLRFSGSKNEDGGVQGREMRRFVRCFGSANRRWSSSFFESGIRITPCLRRTSPIFEEVIHLRRTSFNFEEPRSSSKKP